jgi:type IV secretory pathway ATPase VirB11/archaellum biosynthesis ATPase
MANDEDDDFDIAELSEEAAATKSRWLTRQEELRKRGREVEMPTADNWHPASEEAADQLTHWLGDKEVSELHGNGLDQFFIVKNGEMMQIKTQFHSVDEYNAFLRAWVDEAETPRTWTDLIAERGAVVKMHEGSSLTLIFPPMARTNGKGPLFVVRKHNLSAVTLEAYGKLGTFSPEMFEYLKACVRAEANILIVGGMGSGKTSLMSALTEIFPNNKRVILGEEVPEIDVRQPNVANLQYHPDEDRMHLSHMMDKTLYLRGDRLIVGEMHTEGLTLTLEAFMRGEAGGMFTYHAGNIDQCLDRMTIGLLRENPNFPVQMATLMVQQAIDVVVVLGRRTVIDAAGKETRQYRCRQIAELDWRARGDDLGRKIYWEWDQKTDTFVRKDAYDQSGKVQDKADENGVPIDLKWFHKADIASQLGREHGRR